MAEVLCIPKTATSAVKLGYKVASNSELLNRREVVVRWGHSGGSEFPRVVNKAESIIKAADKPLALRLMAAAGVNVPTMYTSGAHLPRETGVRYVIRPDSHAEGSDFTLVNGGQAVPQGFHATRFISPTREYRYWFTPFSAITSRRVPRTSAGQSESDPCRSKWGYAAIRTPYQKQKEQAQKAIQALGLDFGAIDMLWSESDSKWWTLEVNSAPSLDRQDVRSFMVDGINRRIRELE